MTFVVSSVTRCNDSTRGISSASAGSSPRAGDDRRRRAVPAGVPRRPAAARPVRLRGVLRARPDRRARTRRRVGTRRAGRRTTTSGSTTGRRGTSTRSAATTRTTGDWRAYRLSDFVEMRTFPLEPDLRRVVPAPARREPDHGRPRRAALAHEGLPPRAERRPRLRASDCLVLDVLRPYLAMRYAAARRGVTVARPRPAGSDADAREREILALVAEGKTNAEIAERALDRARHRAPAPRERVREARRAHANGRRPRRRRSRVEPGIRRSHRLRACRGRAICDLL